ncbi:MAG: 3-keto-disaccharide hydrolase [Gemmatimonadales bacterium]
MAMRCRGFQSRLAMLLMAAGVAPLTAQSSINTLTAAQRKAGWQLLFDGHSTVGWRGYQSDSVPSAWHVERGLLTKSGSTGDLVTTDQFGDFELSLDWKIGPAGNSGIFYRATEEYEHIYWSGPEYQLLDDAAAPDGKNRLTAAGAAYGLYPSPAGVVKPANQWNTTRIVVKGQHVEHWLNGTMLLAYDLGSPDWAAKVKASKFGVWPDYGRASRGYIGIQGDHSGELSLRNIRIRER